MSVSVVEPEMLSDNHSMGARRGAGIAPTYATATVITAHEYAAGQGKEKNQHANHPPPITPSRW